MWTARVLLLFPQIILVPFLIGAIGERGYGVYALVWSLMMSIDHLEKSLQSGVVKYSAGFLAQGRTAEVNKVVSSSFVYSLFLAAAACAAIFLAAAGYLGTDRVIAASLGVVGAGVLLTIPITPYVAVVQARQRYYVGAIAETVGKYLSLLAIFLWFRLATPSVEAVVIIMTVLLFLSRLVQVPVAHRLVAGLRNRVGLFDRHSFRLIASFGAMTVLIALCIVTNKTGVRWVMSVLESPRFVAHLAIIVMPGMLLTQIVQAATLTVMPATSAYAAKGDRRILQELLTRGVRYTTFISLAGVLTASLLMRHALRLWVGPDFEFLTPYAFTVFTGISFMLTSSTGHHMLKGLSQLRTIVHIYALTFVLVPVAVILAITVGLDMPYLAVAAGLLAGHVSCGVLQLRSAINAVGVDRKEFLFRAYGQPLAVGGILLAVVVGVLALGLFEGLPARFCMTVAVLGLLAAGCYLFAATRAERQQVMSLINAVAARLPSPKRKVAK